MAVDSAVGAIHHEPGAFYGEEIENTLIVGLQVKAAL